MSDWEGWRERDEDLVVDVQYASVAGGDGDVRRRENAVCCRAKAKRSHGLWREFHIDSC